MSESKKYRSRQSLADAWQNTFEESERTKKASDISWIVWLCENPDSPLAFHGAASLYNHDHIHLILGRCLDKKDEAFVIGFTMGNDSKTSGLEVALFKFISFFLYPEAYRFDREHLRIFDLGFQYGRSRKFKGINTFDFSKIDHRVKLSRLRRFFDISDEILNEMNRRIQSVKGSV
jgi:hypothetical protein